MHELAVTKELIRLVLSNSSKPKSIHVELGKMTTYKPDPLQYYFNILKKEYPELVNTTLHVVECDPVLVCSVCHAQSVLSDPFIELCPECHSSETEIKQGKEFILLSITEY